MRFNLVRTLLLIPALLCMLVTNSYAEVEYELIKYEYKLVPTTKSPLKLPWAWLVKSKEVFVYQSTPLSNLYTVGVDTMFQEQIRYKASVEAKLPDAKVKRNIKSVNYYDAELTNIFNSNSKRMTFDLGYCPKGSRVTIEREFLSYSIPFTNSHNFRLTSKVKLYELSFSAPKGVTLNFLVTNNDNKLIIDNRSTTNQSDYRLTYKDAKEAVLFNDGLGLDFFVPTAFFNVKSWQENGKTVEFLSSVGQVKQLYNDLFFKRRETDNLEILKPLAAELFANSLTEEAKIDQVMRWVRTNITYLAFGKEFAGWVPQAAHVTYQKRYGDCKAVSQLIEQLLKLGNVKVTKALIGTAEMAEDIVTLPGFSAFNHMVAIATVNGKKYLLDGTTSPYHDWRIPPISLLNKNALMIDDQDLVYNVQEQTKGNISKQLDGKMSIVGNQVIIRFKTEITKFDSDYAKLRSKLDAETTPEGRIDVLTKHMNNHLKGTSVVIDSSRLPNENDLYGPVMIAMTATVSDAVKQFGNSIYFCPEDAFLTMVYSRPNPIREDPMERHKSVENQLYTFEIEIPDGWSVGSLPQNYYSDTTFERINSRHWSVSDKKVCYVRQFMFNDQHYYYTNGRLEEFYERYKKYITGKNQFIVLTRNK